MISTFDKKLRRAHDAIEKMMSAGFCSFVTLTTPDVCDLAEIRRRWRALRHYFVERDELQYIMNYEVHPRGHGWHIHMVCNRYINLKNGGLRRLQAFGFGRINVKRVDTQGVADYLSKHVRKSYKTRLGDGVQRVRLVNTSRNLPKLSDYFFSSPVLDAIRAEYGRVLRDYYVPPKQCIEYYKATKLAVGLEGPFELAAHVFFDLTLKSYYSNIPCCWRSQYLYCQYHRWGSVDDRSRVKRFRSYLSSSLEDNTPILYDRNFFEIFSVSPLTNHA